MRRHGLCLFLRGPGDLPLQVVCARGRGLGQAVLRKVDSALPQDCHALLFLRRHGDSARLRALVGTANRKLKSTGRQAGARERDLERIRCAGCEALRQALERQLAGLIVGRVAEMTGRAGILPKTAGHPRGRTVAEMEREQRRCGEESRQDRGNRPRGGPHGVARVRTRPIWLASVPNHIAPVFGSYIMWRTVSLTSCAATNFSLFGSKTTSFLSGPVCESQSRPSPSWVSA